MTSPNPDCTILIIIFYVQNIIIITTYKISKTIKRITCHCQIISHTTVNGGTDAI